MRRPPLFQLLTYVPGTNERTTYRMACQFVRDADAVFLQRHGGIPYPGPVPRHPDQMLALVTAFLNLLEASNRFLSGGAAAASEFALALDDPANVRAFFNDMDMPEWLSQEASE